MFDTNKTVIGIIGLGYVGLPLAVEFGKKIPTVGFDINPARIAELCSGKDNTLEVEPNELKLATFLTYSDGTADLSKCNVFNVFIVSVPTPINNHKLPDLSPLERASETLGKVIKQGDTVIFVDQLYAQIIIAGTHKTRSIRVAEAVKVIENTQRDLNIALINELALIFNRLGIDTLEVLEAAGTKWNFLPFRPGLVGGHCIGVDPYYLTYKAQEIGYHPEVILAGRRINDGMGSYIADRVLKLMLKNKIYINDSNILILGLAFKENCPDIRNTRVVDIIEEFSGYGANIDVFDSWVNCDEAQHEYGIKILSNPERAIYDAIILAVPHNEFIEMGIDNLRSFGKDHNIFFDVKSIFPLEQVDGRL